MDIVYNKDHLNLETLIRFSKDDDARMHKYLVQFQELIPERIINLKECMQLGDRKKIRQVLHQISPQLQFFGVPEVVGPIKKLELEYETIPEEELKEMVALILTRLGNALGEIEHILNEYFKDMH